MPWARGKMHAKIKGEEFTHPSRKIKTLTATGMVMLAVISRA
jgi:hypothetical protein